jgi:zinc transport system permease protein
VNLELSQAEGMRPEQANIIFMLLMAAVIAISMKIVGVLLITSMLIFPAAIARRFASGPEQMAVLAALIGVIAVFGGLFGSLQWDTPAGPSIVVAASIFFIITVLSAVIFQIVKSTRINKTNIKSNEI